MNDRDTITIDEHTTISATYRVAIRTRYYGPGNLRGSRVRVWRADDTWQGDPCRVEVGWNYALGIEENHRAAIAHYLRTHAEQGHGWEGAWVLAGAGDGYVAVQAGKV